ncbi:EAL domain-containing protein [Acetobacteraceae bacterium H6797]|nr:EAL domain-containing protein [Acetobacteraceae bacterium H6797]
MRSEPLAAEVSLASFIRSRLLTVLFPLLLGVSGFCAAGGGAWQFFDVQAEIRDRTRAVMPGIATSVVEPLWSFRYEQVGRVLEGLTRNPDVLAATVFDELGHPIATIGRAPEEGSGITPLRQVINRLPDSGFARPSEGEERTQMAGSLLIWPNPARAWAEARNDFISIFLFISFSGLIVLGVVRLLLGRLLRQPLNQMLAKLRSGEDGGEALPAVWRSLGEVGEIAALLGSRQAERKDNERALREAHTRLNRIYNGTPVLLHSVDRHGSLLGVNDHWLAATGYERLAVLGRPFASLLTPQSARRYREEILPRLLETGRTPEARIQLVRADGRVMELLLSEMLDRSGTAGLPVSLSVMTDISPLQIAERQLERAAQTDQLTGLLNRVGFMSAATAMLEGGMHQGEEALLLQINFDRFKWVNDTHGMAVGDRVLSILAERISQVAGEEAVSARLSGDEFAILLRVGPRTAERLENIRAVTTEPVFLPGLRLDLAASIGLARYPADGITLDTLLGAADLAMLVAKREGRHKLVAFGAAHARAQRQRQSLRRKVQSALENERFDIHVQPVIRVTDGAVTGAEVLARMHGPEGESISPAEFIPAAEESGQIVALGRYVMERALAALPGLVEASGNPDFSLAINLSAGQVSEELPDEVAAMVARHGVEPRQIVLEITETALFADEARAEEVLAALASRGFRFALDDFGSGHSSVGYLTRLPVHLVKIERGFTATLGHAESPAECRRRAIVRAVVALSQELNLPVVAEGVETQAELAAVRELGIPLVQGYLFARPMPVEMAREWMAARHKAVVEATGLS